MNEDMKRIVDLLLEKALHGLPEQEELELETLLAGVDEHTVGRLELQLEAAIAAAGNASVLADEDATPVAPPPARLLASLEADADRFFGTDRAPVVDLDDWRQASGERSAERAGDTSTPNVAAGVGNKAPRRWAAWSGWAVAALLLVSLWTSRPGTEAVPVPLTPLEARAALLAESTTVRYPWSPSAWEEYEGVTGDVSWNDERQEGYLRLVGMPANDPGRSQYQLWIVDPERDEQPVDGGVFDVSPGPGEVIIPIRAALSVDAPAAFAITREQPGGVVVSDGPLLVVASRG